MVPGTLGAPDMVTGAIDTPGMPAAPNTPDTHAATGTPGADKPAAASTAAFATPLPRYTNLKHELQSSYKAIYRAVHAGILPPADAVQAFTEQSRLMTRYEDAGFEYYAPYNAALERFLKAWTSADIAAMHDAVDALNHVKTDCHQRYK